jgi:hypothetical protein
MAAPCPAAVESHALAQRLYEVAPGALRCRAAHGVARHGREPAWMIELPNRRMQVTKLRAAPVLQAEVPPCASAGKSDAGTALQLVRGVRRLVGG